MKNLEQQFAQIRNAHLISPASTLQQRVTQLKALRKALIDATPKIIQSLSEDYGYRSAQDTLIADITPCLSNIDYTLKNLEAWMTVSPREAGHLLSSTSSVEVHYQPKGVVGIITPWNFPVFLSIGPLIGALAAGNRAMIKLSELTPNLNRALRVMLESIFKETEVVVIEGEAGVGAAFSALPFNHLFFTGSPRVGKLVMKAAAENLTPVTLELGGKSPVLVDSTISVKKVVERIICGKSLNSGQVCVAPDYILLPEGKELEFVQGYQSQFAELYPEGVNSPSWTSVINEQQFERQLKLLKESQDSGTTCYPAHKLAVDSDEHRMVTHLLVDPDLESTVMQEEIFGPILPIITYRDFDDAIAIINRKETPLALYLMSEDKQRQQSVQRSLLSGGMAINDAIFHIAADDAPFGGVGNSGMGNYHGKEGFLTFSHAKTVLTTYDQYHMKSLFSPEDNEFKSALNQYFY